MLKKVALGFGVVFLFFGVMGFVPGGTDSEGRELLFGIFTAGILHNIILIASGAIGLLAAGSERYARWYLQIFGLVFAVMAVGGFLQGDTVLGIYYVTLADNLLHAGVALALLAAGFGLRAKHDNTKPAGPPPKPVM